jgi:hypothetical protein
MWIWSYEGAAQQHLHMSIIGGSSTTEYNVVTLIGEGHQPITNSRTAMSVPKPSEQSQGCKTFCTMEATKGKSGSLILAEFTAFRRRFLSGYFVLVRECCSSSPKFIELISLKVVSCIRVDEFEGFTAAGWSGSLLFDSRPSSLGGRRRWSWVLESEMHVGSSRRNDLHDKSKMWTPDHHTHGA